MSLARLLSLRDGEVRAVLTSALFFFLTLCAYFAVRSVREALGVARGVEGLRHLFLITLVATLALQVGLSGRMARIRRSGFAPLVFRGFALFLLAFWVLRRLLPELAQSLLGPVFYVLVTVAVLFLTALFWGLMADGFSVEQAPRVFPIVAVGGTSGAIAGSWLAARSGLSPDGLVLAGAALLEAAVRCARSLERQFRSAAGSSHPEPSPRIGGGPFCGMSRVLRSPYLLGIAAYISLMAIANTLLYFAQGRIVADASAALEVRQRLFARIDLWTNVATLFVQLFVAGRLIRWLGVTSVLLALPAVTILAFLILAHAGEALAFLEPSYPAFGALLLAQTAHRTTRYAVARPARELLFTVCPREDKYLAKSFVDTVCYRGGDALGTFAHHLTERAALAVTSLPVVVAPLALVWGALALALGSGRRRRARSLGTDPGGP